MSALHTIMATDLAGLLAAAGQPATHTAADGTETAIALAAFVEQPKRRSNEPDGQAVVRRAAAIIPVADVAAPAAGDTMEFDASGETWTITHVTAAGTGHWRCHIARSEPLERARDGYRMSRP